MIKHTKRAIRRIQTWPILFKRLAGLALILIFLLIFPGILYLPASISEGNGAASFYFVAPPDANFLSLDSTFKVELRVKSPRVAINSVGSVIKVDPQMLEILTVSTATSFCSFYPDNAFDTIKGEVTISCGTPHPGFQGDSSVITITMRPKNFGTTKVSLDSKEAMVLADDGKGTNLLRKDQLPSLALSIQRPF